MILHYAKELRAHLEEWAVKNEQDPNKLTGLCGIACILLSRKLTALKINHEIWHSGCHAFLILPNDKVLDITATQFGNFPKVLYCDFEECKHKVCEYGFIWDFDDLYSREELKELTSDWLLQYSRWDYYELSQASEH